MAGGQRKEQRERGDERGNWQTGGEAEQDAGLGKKQERQEDANDGPREGRCTTSES